jgi:hypothetical protein
MSLNAMRLNPLPAGEAVSLSPQGLGKRVRGYGMTPLTRYSNASHKIRDLSRWEREIT